MADNQSAQALSTSHADLITYLAFSSSSPSLLASTSLDGWIRVHARTAPSPSTSSNNSRKGKTSSSSNHGVNGVNSRMALSSGHDANVDEEDEDDEDVDGKQAGDADEWLEIGSCKANEGPVWRAIWGPREYGTSVLVSIAGSVVNVWETRLHTSATNESTRMELLPRATLVEARGSLRDVAFAPSEFGMKLASIAADSHLRIYECLDPSSSGLASWSLLEDIDLLALPASYYSPSPQGSNIHTAHYGQNGGATGNGQTQLIKGFDDTPGGGGAAAVAGGSSGVRAALGPSGGSSVSLGAQSTSSASSLGKSMGRIESSGAWAVSYCQEAWWGECVAVSAGREGLIRILHFAPPSYWSQVVVLQPPATSSTSPISTIAWAPSSGRSYHLIASGSRDGIVRIWKVVPSNDPAGHWEASLAAQIEDHVDGSSGGVGKVEWNVTGTVLSTAGCDGVVRLWKASYSGEWRVLSAISCEGDNDDGTSTSRRR